MSYSVYFSDPGVTAKAGFGLVAHLPCIFDSRPGYHRTASQYLIDRGLGLWSMESRGKRPLAVAPTQKTIRSYAAWLANFLEWAEVRGVDLLSCDYVTHVYGRYQADMLNGRWSRDGVALSASTVNGRVMVACEYLSWLSDKGLRRPFEVPYEVRRIKGGSATSAIGHLTKDVQVRRGKVRQNKRRLRMPTDGDLKAWLSRVYLRFGETKGLMCEMILLTAMRREEVACFRVDTLPENVADWHINNPTLPRPDQRVLITLRYGTKGKEYGMDHGDKIGPERSIWIPLVLAERLHEYRGKVRPQHLLKWLKAAAEPSERRHRAENAVHLFVDVNSGKRLSGKDLYTAWHGVELPYKGWSPHLGRDWWACSILWQELKKHENIRDLGIETAAALLESTAMSIIRLKIQPQLGHSRDSTSMIYLQWAADMLGVNLAIDYEAELENHEIAGELEGNNGN